jgi:hypothetical protein
MAIKHNSTYIRPGNLDYPSPDQWNADHLFVPLVIPFNIGNVTWTNQPAALTEIFGAVHRRGKFDLTNATQIRISARVSTVGTATSVIYAQYSTDDSAYVTLTANQIAMGTIGTKVTAWENVPVGAKGDVFIKFVGLNGDAAADPIIGNLYLEVK